MIIQRLYALWLPIILITIQLVLEFSLPQNILASLHSESGPHEILQFLIITAAFVYAIRILMLKPWSISIFLASWVGVAALGALYISGEEISWGQHILQWGTPDYWQQLNDQGETNLHNTSSWLDQKPRLVLEIGMLIGGLIIPLLLKFKPDIVPQKFNIIYPTAAFIPMTVIALFINIADKVAEIWDISIFERASEVEEIFLFYFVLVYLIMLYQRIRVRLAP